jgi:hypothetical protein
LTFLDKEALIFQNLSQNQDGVKITEKGLTEAKDLLAKIGIQVKAEAGNRLSINMYD